MARRTKKVELEFGSDSFLDVIANIVGILIILIVIAGLRVSQAPLPSLFASTPTPAPVSTEPGPVLAQAIEVPDPEEELEPLPEDYQPPAGLVLQLKELEDEIAALEQETSNRAAELQALENREQTEKEELSSTEQAVADRAADRNRQLRKLKRLSETVAERKAVLAQLLAQLEALKQTTPTVKKVQHRVTPIARMVQGDEVHFRLHQGRVAVVPLSELIKRLLRQAERQKDWLAQYRTHEGTVGPVNGFTMSYIIERQAMSVVDQVNRGAGSFRVAVTAFKVLPEKDLKGETAEEASRMGSEFHIALQTAQPGSTLTLWVYPDSYPLYRRLQALAHDSGFTVAARPLPFGVPIAGSPSGTRSAGQ